MENAIHSLPPEVETFLKEEAEKKGILISDHIVYLLTAYYYGRQHPVVDLTPRGRFHN